MTRGEKQRIQKMTKKEYAYHYQNADDDPHLSGNIFRIILLAMRWFSYRITPREEQELINNLYYLRQSRRR